MECVSWQAKQGKEGGIKTKKCEKRPIPKQDKNHSREKLQHEMNATWKSATWDVCRMRKVQKRKVYHVITTTSNKSKLKVQTEKLQQEKSATREECKREKVQHEKSATTEECKR